MTEPYNGKCPVCRGQLILSHYVRREPDQINKKGETVNVHAYADILTCSLEPAHFEISQGIFEMVWYQYNVGNMDSGELLKFLLEQNKAETKPTVADVIAKKEANESAKE